MKVNFFNISFVFFSKAKTQIILLTKFEILGDEFLMKIAKRKYKLVCESLKGELIKIKK